MVINSTKPLPTLTAETASPSGKAMRVGLLAGQFEVPDDIDNPYEDEVVRLFEGE